MDKNSLCFLYNKLKKLEKMMDDHEEAVRGTLLAKKSRFQQVKQKYERGNASDEEYYDALEEYISAYERWENISL